MLLHCGAICWGGVQEGTMSLAQLLDCFHLLLLLPTIKLGPSGATSQVDGFVYILGPYGSLQQILLWGWEFLPPPHPPQVFAARGFEAFFSHSGTLGCIVCFTPQLYPLVYPHANVGMSCLLATALLALVLQLLPYHKSSPPWLPVSTTLTSLDDCFFFNSLVVVQFDFLAALVVFCF